MIKKNGISYKTIQKNKRLGEFIEGEEEDLEEEQILFLCITWQQLKIERFINGCLLQAILEVLL